MAEQPASFVQQQKFAPLGLKEGELVYVARNDIRRCGARSARRFETGTYIRSASVNDMGRHYTARAQ